MLKGHKYCHFTPFSDKTNEQIFLKIPKIQFWVLYDHFWSFLMERDFPKNFPCGPPTPYKVLEKTNKPIQENHCKEGQMNIHMEGRMDERIDLNL